ncbi:hypothetical protein [Conexibacter sp. S30A1]|uniref:hypothetical protein n=1 Tax=Conexibacter sp. S30A1 TaxID=2937800 RepID=UPI00200BBAEC|nr:hypothetical protein [Conexibacter sp. S30A1]
MTDQERAQLPGYEPGARRLLEALIQSGLDAEALTAAAALCIALDEGPRGRTPTTRVQDTDEPDEIRSFRVMLAEAMNP